jgi:hypothetical protein
VAEKIIVCCRFSHEGIRVASHYLPRARALTTRAEALGATLCAWSALTMAFAWDPDGIEEAIDLATTLTGGAGDPGPGERSTSWACGIAQGEMEQLAEKGSRADLAWGMSLVVALALSRIAKYGEVLLHGSLTAVANGTVNTLDARSDSDVGFEARGLRLDRKNPWKVPRKASTPKLNAVRPPPPSPHELLIAALPPMRPRASTFPSIPESRYATPSSFDTEEVDPEALAARLMQLSKDALLCGDANSLERWSDGLMATGEKDSFAERMRAMARLARGRVGDALRALEAARTKAEVGPPAKRCQAALALAVGLAFAGRADEALLEGLDALARAREGKDDRASRACLAFLAKLFTSVGRHQDATHLTVAGVQLMSIPPAAR